MTAPAAPSRTAAGNDVGEALRELAARVDRLPAPLPGLDGVGYGRAHALFEARSDQRQLLEGRLAALLPRTVPLHVLSIGCGDGALDAVLAASAVRDDPARILRWQGVEPLAASAEAFLEAMAAVPAPGLHADVVVGPFGDLDPRAHVDVVTFVHCLYYVPDVLAALRRAASLLVPGGTVLVAHAPRAGLNELGTLLAPQHGSHPMWWSETTAALVGASGLVGAAERLTAHVDLSVCRDLDDPAAQAVLDFTVQARLPRTLRPGVLDVLDALSLPGTDLVVEHPVDVWALHAHDDHPEEHA